MKTIQELLADKPEALAHVEKLIAAGDIWIVGGAARALMYPLPFPSDIDLLVNTERTILTETEKAFLSSNEQGQKVDVAGVKLDVFGNSLVKWLHGVPCNGDGLAIRARDNFVLMTGDFIREDWAAQSKSYSGIMRPDYLVRHQLSLLRDAGIVFAAAQEDIRDETT